MLSKNAWSTFLPSLQQVIIKKQKHPALRHCIGVALVAYQTLKNLLDGHLDVHSAPQHEQGEVSFMVVML